MAPASTRVDSMKTTTMSNLQSIRVDLDRLEDELRATVAEAREAGETWQAIGDALGITRQAACKRWAR